MVTTAAAFRIRISCIVPLRLPSRAPSVERDRRADRRGKDSVTAARTLAQTAPTRQWTCSLENTPGSLRGSAPHQTQKPQGAPPGANEKAMRGSGAIASPRGIRRRGRGRGAKARHRVGHILQPQVQRLDLKRQRAVAGKGQKQRPAPSAPTSNASDSSDSTSSLRRGSTLASSRQHVLDRQQAAHPFERAAGAGGLVTVFPAERFQPGAQGGGGGGPRSCRRRQHRILQQGRGHRHIGPVLHQQTQRPLAAVAESGRPPSLARIRSICAPQADELFPRPAHSRGPGGRRG